MKSQQSPDAVDRIEKPVALMVSLVILRVAIGWHFLYEGVVKLLADDWSAGPFLAQSRWLLSGLFRWMAETPAVLHVVNLLNVWGLILIGLGLMLGSLTRLACLAGIVLLGLYYVAAPPLIGMDFGVPQEGTYLIVNKTLVELVALCVLAVVPTGHFVGLDRLWTQAGRNRLRCRLLPVRIRSCAAIVGENQRAQAGRFSRRDFGLQAGPQTGILPEQLLRQRAEEGTRARGHGLGTRRQ